LLPLTVLLPEKWEFIQQGDFYGSTETFGKGLG
jgi:hypothetical protein